MRFNVKKKYTMPVRIFYIILAPLIGIVASNIDNRLLGIVGGVMSGVSVIGASFADNVQVLLLFLSIFNGM